MPRPHPAAPRAAHRPEAMPRPNDFKCGIEKDANF